MNPQAVIYEVAPARLRPGAWSHDLNRQVGEGDIAASYSADRIGMNKPVRTPFEFRGAFYVCTSMRGGTDVIAEAYQFVPLRFFDGRASTYAKKTADCDTARNDPLGFYHGMTVKHHGKQVVLTGPPVQFIAGQQQQLDLF